MADKSDEKRKKGSRRLESFIATSELAKASKERAQNSFYKLIEDKVSVREFSEELKYINPEIYDDVVTDRSIAKLCGYPLCSKTFEDKFGQRTYTIVKNVVYDITVRRNFCSDICYEASQIVRNQISTSPLYVRKDDAEGKIIIPSRKKLTGLHGKSIDITGLNYSYSEPKNNATDPSILVEEIAREGLVNCSENSKSQKKSSNRQKKFRGNLSNIDEGSEDLRKVNENLKESEKGDERLKESQKVDKGEKETQKIGVNSEAKTGAIQLEADCGKNSESDIKYKSDKQNIQEKGTNILSQCENDPLLPVIEVQTAMRQWMTFETLRFTLGDNYVRGMLEDFGHSWQDYDTRSGLNLGVNAKAKYIALCRKLDTMEIMEEREMNALINEDEDEMRPSQPIPDYEQLKKDAKEQALKVVSFFGGREQYEALEDVVEDTAFGLSSIPEEESSKVVNKKGIVPRKGKKKKGKEEEIDIETSSLPLIDSLSQLAWRQQIVIDKTKMLLSEIIAVTDLDGGKVRPLFKELVNTLHLESHNISFRPAQWNLITLIFLKLLSIRYLIIQSELEKCCEIQENIIRSFNLDMEYFTRVVCYLTEIQPIIGKDYGNKNLEADKESAQSMHSDLSCDRKNTVSPEIANKKQEEKTSLECDSKEQILSPDDENHLKSTSAEELD